MQPNGYEGPTPTRRFAPTSPLKGEVASVRVPSPLEGEG